MLRNDLNHLNMGHEIEMYTGIVSEFVKVRELRSHVILRWATPQL